ncbi:MAG: helix-turn-helix transcriptional regulator [Clostridia bacterium]|nr:helix-turn-helix transcriptional regulator [Clostridia bacterium]
MTITQAVILRTNELLAEKKMTKTGLAKKSGVSLGTIQSIYKQLSKGITLATLFLLCEGFDITPSEFLDSDYFRRVDDV